MSVRAHWPGASVVERALQYSLVSFGSFFEMSFATACRFSPVILSDMLFERR